MGINRRTKREKIRKLRKVEPRLKELVEETKVHLHSGCTKEELEEVVRRFNGIWSGICHRYGILEFLNVYVHQVGVYNKKLQRDGQKTKEKKV